AMREKVRSRFHHGRGIDAGLVHRPSSPVGRSNFCHLDHDATATYPLRERGRSRDRRSRLGRERSAGQWLRSSSPVGDSHGVGWVPSRVPDIGGDG
ncbi:hypothetical protein A2U01_0069301, partial [Trifolium medium]|nr:hypothetical protein [Trifolium medium]